MFLELNMLLRILTIAILAPIPAVTVQASANESEVRCKVLTKYEESLSKRLPVKVDSVTDLIAMRVNCSNTTQTWVRKLKVLEVDLESGWRERKQRQQTQLNCNREGLSNVAKWTVIDIFYDKNSNWLAEFVTKPQACIDR